MFSNRLDVLLLAPPRHRFHFFFFNDTATTEIYTLSLHDALPILSRATTSGEKKATCPGRRESHVADTCRNLETVTPFDDIDESHTSYHGQSTQTRRG